MAANKTVPQLWQSHNCSLDLLVPRHGVVTLYGYGIQVRLDRGHLFLEDGIGADRRRYRLPRVGHGLKRLVVIGSDGMVSLAALRWLADQDASLVLLERDGSVLATTGPVRSSDAKLRRAQALAHTSGAALRITRELISQKLAGQERVARHKLLDSTTADTIAQFRAGVPTGDNIVTIRLIESQGARAYWSAGIAETGTLTNCQDLSMCSTQCLKTASKFFFWPVSVTLLERCRKNKSAVPSFRFR